MQAINIRLRILITTILVYVLLYVTIALKGQIASILTIIYGVFITVLNQYENWYIRVCFVLVLMLAIFLIYKFSNSKTLLNILLAIILILSIPFLSMDGL